MGNLEHIKEAVGRVMEIKSYRSVYIILEGDNGIPIIRTGRFPYRWYEHSYLQDVTIEYHEGSCVVHGWEVIFYPHDNDDGPFSCNIDHKTEEFCIKEKDWYYQDTWFGYGKPIKRLKQGKYKKKRREERLFIFTQYTQVHYSE